MDIKKYDNIKLHEDPLVDKKVKALFLHFDKKYEELKLTTRSAKIQLLNLYIFNLAKHEEYEVAKAFKDRKIRIYKKWRLNKRKKSLRLKYRIFRFKFSKFLRNIFK